MHARIERKIEWAKNSKISCEMNFGAMKFEDVKFQVPFHWILPQQYSVSFCVDVDKNINELWCLSASVIFPSLVSSILCFNFNAAEIKWDFNFWHIPTFFARTHTHTEQARDAIGNIVVIFIYRHDVSHNLRYEAWYIEFRIASSLALSSLSPSSLFVCEMWNAPLFNTRIVCIVSKWNFNLFVCTVKLIR